MKHRAAELEGELLDAAVALAEGHRLLTHRAGEPGPWIEVPYPQGIDTYHPSRDWDVGGPIIERERIELHNRRHSDRAPMAEWAARMAGSLVFGPTPLIAAMRAYVAAELGEEVELP